MDNNQSTVVTTATPEDIEMSLASRHSASQLMDRITGVDPGHGVKLSLPDGMDIIAFRQSIWSRIRRLGRLKEFRTAIVDSRTSLMVWRTIPGNGEVFPE